MIRHRSPWPLVLLLYLTGLLAAAQLGKMSALAPLIAADLGLQLPTMALAISLLEVGGACLGAMAGLLAHRLGLRRCLRWGVAALALGGLGGALAQGATGLLGWRLLEALGYLGVIVTAPVLIAHHSLGAADAAGRRCQGLALTLWSTFVPVGLALGAWAYAGVAAAWGGPDGWRRALAVGGAVALLSWVVVWRWPVPAALEAGGAEAESEHAGTAAPAGPAGTGLRASGARSLSLALAFGGFALFEVGLLGLLPSLLVQEAGLSAAAAGRWTGLASLAAVPGSAWAAWLLRHGRPSPRLMLWALGLPALLLFGVFVPAPHVPTALSLAVAINVLGGVFASLAFALLPAVAGSSGQMVRANGWLAQCGASGSLLGPPLMAACVQAGGWPAAAWLGLAVTAAALPLAWRACAGSAGVDRQASHPVA